MWDRFTQWVINKLTEHDERHGITLSMYIEAAPLKTDQLWLKLHAALDLIVEHSPIWLQRMKQINNTVHVRRIPGTRAMLTHNRYTILDPYLLADFPPSQIAASIIHEATHALLRSYGFSHDAAAPAREERACRRSEVRFGTRLLRAGVEGAQAVLERAQPMVSAPDQQVGVVVDWQEWRDNGLITRINDLRIPRWAKRMIARRYGVLDTPRGRAAFGK